MIAPNYKAMVSAESVIRIMNNKALERMKVCGKENVFNFTIGNPSVPAPPETAEIIKDLLDHEDPMLLHGYNDRHGIPLVREQIAASLTRRIGLPYTAKHIFMCSGATAALAHALRAVSVPGEEIVYFAPNFPEYRIYVEASGAVPRIVPPRTEDFQIDFAALERLLSEKTAAVLINSPNNPSGVVYSTATIERLAELLRQKSRAYGHKIYLISDEPYREIIFKGVDSPVISRYYDDTIICYSFAKGASIPGERIGYVAVSPRCQEAELIVQMCPQISRCTGHNCPSSLMQLLAGRMADLTADLSVYERNAELMYGKLKELGFECVRPGGTFYLFPKALEEDSVAFCERALQHNLVFVPGDSFGCPGWFRISCCVPTERIERAFPNLEALAAEYRT